MTIEQLCSRIVARVGARAAGSEPGAALALVINSTLTELGLQVDEATGEILGLPSGSELPIPEDNWRRGMRVPRRR